jgi:aminoglycoside/choline kinase family phosphotransferase
MTRERQGQALEAAAALARRTLPGRFGPGTRAFSIAEGGSDRLFIRAADGPETAVVLWQPETGWEFDSYIEVGRFLFGCGIGVPEIYGFERRAGTILMEDLGETHLEEALAGAPPGEIHRLYEKAIEILVRLQTVVTDEMDRLGFLSERPFDEAKLLGETDYFLAEFIGGYCPVAVPSTFEAERRRLAAHLAIERRVFMHRDFQCRNIMVKEDALRLVDFQTAHRGPGLYDAASLLKDAYHPVSREMREKLLERYYGRLEPYGALGHAGLESFRESFTFAGIQRDMQALAAFAKLGLRKGKTRFLESIPNGLDLLEEGLKDAGVFPGMLETVMRVREQLKKKAS